ncbi:hypothetical protein BDZ88DRAFT_395487, partial [Geranomyces variabilis]
FLVEKLKVQVLPCVVPFIDGVSVDHLVRFELVGDSDNVPTRTIEAKPRRIGVLDLPNVWRLRFVDKEERGDESEDK